MLAHVLSVAERTPEPVRRPGDYRNAFETLRDSLSVERLPEDRASILEQMERIAHLAAQRSRTIHGRLDPGSPYFAHMRLKEDTGRVRDVLLAKETFIREDVTVVDWRNAPISRIFYQSEQGDDFDLSIDGTLTTGVVDQRRTVTINRGLLRRVASPEGTWIDTSEGWREASSPTALAGGEGTAIRPDRTTPVLGVGELSASTGAMGLEREDKHLPAIASLLDPEQFQLITSPNQGLIAISGGAGSGKTTVALHRVAYLAFRDGKRFKPARTQVVVFSPALARYISQVLPALGVDRVPVGTFENWVRRLRKLHFPKLPRRYSESTPAVVTRFKLHSGLLRALGDAATRLDRANPIEVFEDVFTDRGWLRSVADEHSPGAFSSGEIDLVHRWCTRQHFNRVDGGESTEDKPCLDPEDDAILLRLHQLIEGRLRHQGKRPLSYSHLVVDEVQDFSPIELRVLLDTVPKGNPITLAGDTAQKIVEASDFSDWSEVLQLLDREHTEVTPLRVSYRSTAEIMKVALDILGPLAPEEVPVAPRLGVPVERFEMSDQGTAMAFMGDALRELQLRERTASVAVLCRHEGRAAEVFRALERSELLRCRLVLDHDFDFSPGIEVTTIEQVKGLEFDYVVVADCESAVYPDNVQARHLLHVAVTRSAHQVWLISVGPSSPLLPDWLQTQAI